VTQTGDTSTSQLSRRALALRLLSRTRDEVAQLRALVPADPLLLEPPVARSIERLAHKISSETENFGFMEVSAITAAIELLATDSGGGTLRHRFQLGARLIAQIAALEAHVQNEIAELLAQEEAAVPMMELLPGFGARR
jgi:HPt (histidine-containing phosphotransfer) domain-containing protein